MILIILNRFIFTNSFIEFNADYFKTLWSRYKKKSSVIDKKVTLYSFSHTGAIVYSNELDLLLNFRQQWGIHQSR